MRFKTKTSLHTALWLVIAIATVPTLLLAFFDYQQNRRDALLSVTNDAQTMLTMARSSEQAAVREVQQLLRVMAGANEMQSADPAACNMLAQRLIKSSSDRGGNCAARVGGAEEHRLEEREVAFGLHAVHQHGANHAAPANQSYECHFESSLCR